MEERDRNEVTAVVKACELLDCLSKERYIGLSELTRKSGFKKTTVSRLLATLKKVGLVDQDEATQKFFLTMRLVNLAERVRQNFDFRSLTRPLMEKFAQQHGRTIIFALLNEDQIAHVDTVKGKESYRIITTFGEKVPAHCTASGKAILAYLPPEKRLILVGNQPFEALTPNTITDWETLEQDLQVVKKRGFAADLNERFADILALAVPVFGNNGKVIGAITSPKVSTSIDEAAMEEWAAPLLGLGQRVSRRLGWEG